MSGRLRIPEGDVVEDDALRHIRESVAIEAKARLSVDVGLSVPLHPETRVAEHAAKRRAGMLVQPDLKVARASTLTWLDRHVHAMPGANAQRLITANECLPDAIAAAVCSRRFRAEDRHLPVRSNLDLEQRMGRRAGFHPAGTDLVALGDILLDLVDDGTVLMRDPGAIDSKDEAVPGRGVEADQLAGN